MIEKFWILMLKPGEWMLRGIQLMTFNIVTFTVTCRVCHQSLELNDLYRHSMWHNSRGEKSA